MGRLKLLVTVLVFTCQLSSYSDGFVPEPNRLFGAIQVNFPPTAPPRTASDAVRPSARALNVSNKQDDEALNVSNKQDDEASSSWFSPLVSDLGRSGAFSCIMAFCGAVLGPFLDSYHSAFGVLQYDEPIKAILWGTQSQPGLTTAWWVPELFGLAGFLIAWLYVLGDHILETDQQRKSPSPPLILVGISFFTFQYWLSGVLYANGVDRTSILNIMSLLAAGGFVVLDSTFAGFLTSLATAVGGPLIEVGLLLTIQGHGGYHYTDPGETGFFPLWISPVYFLGGPAVGNLARGFWTLLSNQDKGSSLLSSDVKESSIISNKEKPVIRPGCKVCGDTRCVGCPNCDAQGYYMTYGKRVQCNCCKGRGLVICRACFSEYGEDPADIEAIRDIMSKMPD